MSKKHHIDYKHIRVIKELDTGFYREGRPYLVKFNGDPKGKDIDHGQGALGICIEACGNGLTFVFVKGTFVHERFNTYCVTITCQYLDDSKIEIVPYWTDRETLELIDAVKRNPDEFHGAAYWDEEIEILNQEEVETESLSKDFLIINNATTYTSPLIIENEYSVAEINGKHYSFDMNRLDSLSENRNPVRISIKYNHFDDWKTFDDYRIKTVHNPDGFQILRADKEEKGFGQSCSWFPGDILSYVKGLKIEVFPIGYEFNKPEEELNEELNAEENYD